MTNAALRALSVVWMIARILTGEIGVFPEAALPVAQVAYNRLDVGMGYGGWHAIADEPAGWALDAAWEAHRRGGDRNGDLFALSEDDITKLGFDKGNWRNVGTTEWPVWVGRIWR